MASPGWQELICSIRDAALDGRSWHAVARHVAAEFRSPAIALYGQSLDTASFKETAVLGIGDRFIESYKSHYSRLDNPWVQGGRFWKPGVVRTETALQRVTGDRQVLRRSGYFQDWIAPQGYRHSMGMVVDRDAGGYIKLTMYRDGASGAYRRAEETRFQSLCEQFRLLLDIAGPYRLARTLAHLSLRALDHLDFGVMLLNADGAVLEMNRFARDLADGRAGLRVHQGRLEALDARADVRIRTLLEAPAKDGAVTATLAPPAVPSPVTLALTRMASAEGGRLLFLTCPDRAFDERLQLLVDRFAFTPVEIQLARGLLQGLDLRRAGAVSGLSYETSRWYLKQLFAKTDTHRQADLVRLLLATKSEIHLPPER